MAMPKYNHNKNWPPQDVEWDTPLADYNATIPSSQPGVPGVYAGEVNLGSVGLVYEDEFKKEVARLEELVKVLAHRVDDLERGV